MKQHTGPKAHDGYALHSHDVLPDHRDVPRQAPQIPPGGMTFPLTPAEHAAEAARLLAAAPGLMPSGTPGGLLELAVLALAHAITALAASEFSPQGGPGKSRAEGGSGDPAPSVLFPPGWDGQDVTSLRSRILAAMGAGFDGIRAEVLAHGMLMPVPVVVAELEQMAKDGLVARSGITWRKIT
jgi:hypothetical protein